MSALTATTSAYRHLWLLLLLVLLAITLAACSPEADRYRGEGAGTGGDPGNRNSSVQLTGGVPRDDRIYHETPREPLPAQGTGQ